MNDSSSQKSSEIDMLQAKPRKWFQKKRFIIPIGLVLIPGLINAFQGGESTESDTSVSSPAPASSLVVPELAGMRSDDASDTLAELGFLDVELVDASPEGRIVVLASNWKVCATNPVAGTQFSASSTVLVSSVKEDESCPGAETNSAATESEEAPSAYGEQSAIQKSVLEIVEKFKSKFDEATNDLQRADVRLSRDDAICSVTKGSAVSNWTGVVDSIGGTSEGEAYLTVRISDDVTLETWNNGLSDFMDETLIPRKSPLYKIVLGLQEGQLVKFSGKFVPADGACLDTMNFTEFFAINSPEFVFRFTKISPN